MRWYVGERAAGLTMIISLNFDVATKSTPRPKIIGLRDWSLLASKLRKRLELVAVSSEPGFNILTQVNTQT